MKQILIVEDDQSIRDTLRMLLELEGYSVLTADNGSEALEKLRAIEAPCLILLDLMMPVMDGWEFIETKKLTDHIATIPVIVTSAVADRVDSRSVAGIIKKPIEIDLLLQFVKSFCGLPLPSTK